ncbi:MAG: hypothetical protein RLZZ458_3364 [Planctomycetota bacterium]
MSTILRRWLAGALIFAVTGSPVLSSEAVELRSRDVLLHSGSLSGVVLNREAHPVPGIQVRLFHGKQVIAVVTSDENGNFAIHGLRNGGHIVNTGEEKELVRLWTSDIAPPSASARMVMVVDEEVIRGQGCADECAEECGEAAFGQGKSMCSVLTNPAVMLLIGGGVVGALAIAAHNDDDGPASP